MKKFLLSVFLCFVMFTTSIPFHPLSAKASSFLDFVILSQYKATADIGEEFYLLAISSSLKSPTFKSSDSAIASVNTYGKVTAKKAGSATITAKIKGAEASCKVIVNKTEISISKSHASIERNEVLKLSATASNKSEISWKSSRRSIASVDDKGKITGLKPGETTITASADGSSVSCKVIVKAPTVNLNESKITLYRGQSFTLNATVSSGIKPSWKSNKKSVAVIDDSGTVTAIKHGTAVITANVDGVSKRCEVVVLQPNITISPDEYTMKMGEDFLLKATVSSGNLPVWSSSNQNVAIVDQTGRVSGLKKGRAYIYASEDGVKVRCTVYVTD